MGVFFSSLARLGPGSSPLALLHDKAWRSIFRSRNGYGDFGQGENVRPRALVNSWIFGLRWCQHTVAAHAARDFEGLCLGREIQLRRGALLQSVLIRHAASRDARLAQSSSSLWMVSRASASAMKHEACCLLERESQLVQFN
ncbi:hypothetical protein PF003_g34689 [Phytophthora fragariae]|nr:hypothetical protein PF003_g34689 [Phytophthora fragariae]